MHPWRYRTGLSVFKTCAHFGGCFQAFIARHFRALESAGQLEIWENSSGMLLASHSMHYWRAPGIGSVPLTPVLSHQRRNGASHLTQAYLDLGFSIAWLFYFLASFGVDFEIWVCQHLPSFTAGSIVQLWVGALALVLAHSSGIRLTA